MQWILHYLFMVHRMHYLFYMFSACGARYKTRPGLSCHLAHAHIKPEVPPEPQPPHLERQGGDDDKSSTPPPAKTPQSSRDGRYGL